MGNIWKIGRHAPYDKVFGIMEYEHPLMSEPLYILVWLDTKLQVENTGAFLDPISAENYTKEHRERLINKKFEEIFCS